MKTLLAGLLLIAALAGSGCAPGMSAELQLRSAPPPPELGWRDDPRFDYLSDYGVSVIADDGFGYDLFGCGGAYYLYSGNYWYRSQAARGPFVAIDVRRVPRQIFAVDDHAYRWRSHPQGWRGGRQRGDRRGGGPDHDRGGDH